MHTEVKTIYRVLYCTAEVSLDSTKALKRQCAKAISDNAPKHQNANAPMRQSDNAIREAAKELILEGKAHFPDYLCIETESIDAAKATFEKISAGMKNGKPYYSGLNKIYIVPVARLEKEIELDDGEIYSYTLEWRI